MEALALDEMKQKFLFALAVGAAIGALSGLIESTVWLFQIPSWALESSSVPVVMVLYGLVGALATGFWALLARRMGERVFRLRAAVVAFLTMIFLVGGYYINRFWFPEIYTLPSLLFTVIWTCLFPLVALFLLRARPAISATQQHVLWPRSITVLSAFLILFAGVSLIPSYIWNRHHLTQRKMNSAKTDRPNVLLIVMDTTRADRLSSYGQTRKITPNIDHLAEEGVLFEHASSTGAWTFPSHASLFTGLYTSQHGADWSHRRLDSHLTTMAELLGEHGYQTAGFSNNAWIGRSTNFQQGFELYEEMWSRGRLINRVAFMAVFDKLRRISMHRSDHNADLTNQEIGRWLDKIHDANRPFFMFVNYIEPHFVYEPPEPFRSKFLQKSNRDAEKTFGRPLRSLKYLPPQLKFTEIQRGFLNDLYDGEVAYVDSKIGELMNDLRSQGLLDNTVVMIVSDHGENIGDHGLFQHQYCLYDTLVHVPLIVRYPKQLPAGIRVTKPVSLIDILPTVIELLNIQVADKERQVLAGQSLLDSLRPGSGERTLLAQYTPPHTRLERYRKSGIPIDERFLTRTLRSITEGQFKFIWSSDGRYELYNLREDSKESHNIISKFPQVARKLKRDLEKHLASLKPIGLEEPVPQMDKMMRERLRSLGYIQ